MDETVIVDIYSFYFARSFSKVNISFARRNCKSSVYFNTYKSGGGGGELLPSQSFIEYFKITLGEMFNISYVV